MIQHEIEIAMARIKELEGVNLALIAERDKYVAKVKSAEGMVLVKEKWTEEELFRLLRSVDYLAIRLPLGISVLFNRMIAAAQKGGE